MRKICAITAVSEESPVNFHVQNGLILTQQGKNQRISSEHVSSRFLNRLKRNNLFDKPCFNYSDIRQQAFDYDSLKPSKAVDLQNGNSPKLRALTPFNQGYSKFLDTGFGKRRGQFTLEASQSKVSRMGVKEFQFLNNKKYKIKEKITEQSLKHIKLDHIKLISVCDSSNQFKTAPSVSPSTKNKYLKQIEDFEEKLSKFTLKSADHIPVAKRFYDL